MQIPSATSEELHFVDETGEVFDAIGAYKVPNDGRSGN